MECSASLVGRAALFGFVNKVKITQELLVCYDRTSDYG